MAGLLAAIALLSLEACQKMDRPELVIIPDPPPPPYNPLKAYFKFDDNVTDSMGNVNATATNMTYVDGISGKALKGAANGYMLINAPGDTLVNLGSATIAFWMNAPVATKATGIFSMSHKTQFWGNFDLFMEGYNNPTEAFFKMHILNANAADKEQWLEVKVPNVVGKWTHIAIRYDSSTSQISMFADGQPTGIHNQALKSGNYGPLKFADAGGLVIGNMQFMTNPSQTSGAGPQDWAQGFQGALDNFRIYNQALTDAQITELFTQKR
jgi:hypothetical protein